MTHYIDADKLKAEIERRIKENESWKDFHRSKGGTTNFDDVKIVELQSLLSFLDTLESETPNEGLEDILLEFYDEYDSNVENRPLIPRIYAEKLARHFAQWGAEHLADARKTSPNDLEEAADNHIRKVVDAAGHPGWEWETRDIKDAFIAGAKWGAERFAKIVRANLTKIGKSVQSQFEQLYMDLTGNKMYGGYND